MISNWDKMRLQMVNSALTQDLLVLNFWKDRKAAEKRAMELITKVTDFTLKVILEDG